MAQYKFDNNLIELSKNKTIELARLEWRFIVKQELEEPYGLCICQHKIKHANYMFNIYTKHIIMVGTGCSKKLKIQMNVLNNRILNIIIYDMIGEYKLIDNLFEYAEDVKNRLIKYITQQINISNSTILLNILRDEVKSLIDDYNLLDLQHIYDEICCKYKECEEKEQFELAREKKEKEEREKERIAREKREKEEREKEKFEREQERIAKEKREKEQHEKERIAREQKEKEEREKKYIEYIRKVKEYTIKQQREQEQFEEEQREKERIASIKCICGIMKKNICICEKPKYEQCKQTNNLFCKCCKNWKCRCMTSI